MPVATQEEQFKFLISCIRYATNGKIDFAEVAKECQIVSKGAAAKRYERLMKSHGLHQPAHVARETFKPADVKEPKPEAETLPFTEDTDTIAKSYSSPNKKPRKQKKVMEDDSHKLAMYEDEGLIPSSAQRIKAENMDSGIVKEEPQAEYHEMEGFQFLSKAQGGERAGDNCSDLLNDFLQPEDLDPQGGSNYNAFNTTGHQCLGMKGEQE